MNIGITLEIDLEANSKSAMIQNVSDSLEDHFSGKNYGRDIENFFVGFICQRPVPGFESFFKKRKPKYVSSQSIKLLDGSSRVTENIFSYDISLNAETYELFVKAPEKDALVLLADVLIDSLSNFDELPKKVRDFDVEAFRLEVTRYLQAMYAKS